MPKANTKSTEVKGKKYFVKNQRKRNISKIYFGLLIFVAKVLPEFIIPNLTNNATYFATKSDFSNP